MATVQFRARIDRNLKKKSDAVLKSLGLDIGSYISMALTQLVNRRGIPFAVAESDEGYFVSEYGLTPAQAGKAGVAMSKATTRSRRTGRLREIINVTDLAR